MARKDIAMTADEVASFLERCRTLQVATIGADGWPHLAPMWYTMANGRIVFRSFTKSQKIVNLRRDPRLTVLAEAGTSYAELQGVMIKGIAELNDDPEYVLSIYGELSARYPMAPGMGRLEGEALQAAFGSFAAKNTAVIVHPEKTITWDHTKLGGAY